MTLFNRDERQWCGYSTGKKCGWQCATHVPEKPEGLGTATAAKMPVIEPVELAFLAALLREHIDGTHDDVPCRNAEKLNESGKRFTEQLYVKLMTIAKNSDMPRTVAKIVEELTNLGNTR